MTRRRVLISALILMLCAVAVTAMVRYTRRVEHELTHTTAAGRTITFLRDREMVEPFTVPDLSGRPVSTGALKGKVVLVNFWATWCGPCREEIPDLVALQEKYKDQLQIIGIAQDYGAPDLVARFAATYRINYPVVMSTPDIERLFPSVNALPTTFLLDREGRLAKKHVGTLNPSLAEIETRALAGLEVDAAIEYAEDQDKVRLANAAQANKIPGIDLAPLSPQQRAAALQQLNSDHCTCGCGLTVAQCRLDDQTCTVSLPLAQEIVRRISGQH